jgi:hypothetical protein
MRTAVILILLMLLTLSAGEAQTKRVYTFGDSLTATTSWVRFQRPGVFDRISGFSLDHDGGTGNLLVAFSSATSVVDTAAGYRTALRPYEWIVWSGLSIDAIWVRASAGTIPFRLRIW